MVAYTFDIFRKAGIDPRADAVVFGISASLLPASAASELEEWMILNRGIDGSVDLLTLDDDRYEALKALENAGYSDEGDGWAVLRYAALSALGSCGHDLLVDIESVYSDFDYPSDMETFIYYMPNAGQEGSTDAMVENFRAFMGREKERLGL